MKTFEQFISEADFYNFASARRLKDSENYLKSPESKMLPVISTKRRTKMENERSERLSKSPTGTVITSKAKEELLRQLKAQKEVKSQ